jgi:hypothetical protein
MPARKLPSWATDRARLGAAGAGKLTRAEKKTISRHFDPATQSISETFDPKRRALAVERSRNASINRKTKKRGYGFFPITEAMIPKIGKVIELPDGRFTSRTSLDLYITVPKRPYYNAEPDVISEQAHSTAIGPKESAGRLEIAKVRVIVDFSPERLPKKWGRNSSWITAGYDQPDFYRLRKFWQIRTPDGIPIGITRHLGGHIGHYAFQFSDQLRALAEGKPFDEKLLFKAYAPDRAAFDALFKSRHFHVLDRVPKTIKTRIPDETEARARKLLDKM